MKLLLLSSVLLSCLLTAQSREKLLKPNPRIDTTKAEKNDLPPELYSKQKPCATPTLKPKNGTVYMALKEPQKDLSMYKILNSIHREKPNSSKTKPSK